MSCLRLFGGSGAVKSVVTTVTGGRVHECMTKIISCSSSSESSNTSSKLTTFKEAPKIASTDKTFEHYTRSPYKTPGPRRYGHVIKYKTDGVLPRDGIPVKSLPPYRPKDSWSTKRALFGQNDYIDILGDGDIHPVDLLTGPRWLIGFKGNERDRLMRQMEWEGSRLKTFYPSEFNRVEKRIRYLTKLYNMKRKARWAD